MIINVGWHNTRCSILDIYQSHKDIGHISTWSHYIDISLFDVFLNQPLLSDRKIHVQMSDVPLYDPDICYPVQNSLVRNDILSKTRQSAMVTCPKLGSQTHLPVRSLSERKDDPQSIAGKL